MKRLFYILFAVISVACTNEVNVSAPCAIPERGVQYFTDVYPIIDRTCAIPACHVSDFQYGNFKDADAVKKAADNGKLEFMIVTRQMPAAFTKGPAYLTDCEINLITAWIKDGARLN